MPPKTTPDNRYILLWPPTIWLAPVSGKTYAGSGGTFIEVTPDQTLNDIEPFFCWGTEARKYWDSSWSEAKNEWEVKGSKGKTYKVIQNGPTWTCECRGFQFRRDCKHVQNLRILFEG
jgi:hypothetical protein